MLRELGQMGFGQVDLNKEIIRRNEYNLEQSIDELCGILEWDALHDELHELVSSGCLIPMHHILSLRVRVNLNLCFLFPHQGI